MKLKKIKKYITHEREPFFKIAAKYIDESSLVLDIGSGDGSFASIINRDDVYMLDGNPDTISKLKEKFPNVYYGKLPKLPFEDNYFDLIHTSHLVEHLQPEDLYKLLKEIDRCLKPGGVVVISAPLLWSEFFDDMSHIKPYNPKMFEKYLCWGMEMCCTRELISSNYNCIEKVYRYYPLPYDDGEIYIYSEFINTLLRIWKKFKYKIGFRKLEKSGYTVVLKKQQFVKGN